MFRERWERLLCLINRLVVGRNEYPDPQLVLILLRIGLTIGLYCVMGNVPLWVAKRDKNNKSKHWYQKTYEWIYANYCEYSHAVGTKPVALLRFVNLHDDLCVNQLGLDIKHGRVRKGSYFQGLKIRDEFDHDPLSISGNDDPDSPPPNDPPPNDPPPNDPPPNDHHHL